MKEEAVKTYKVPTEAPRDLVEAYFEVKRRALRGVLNHVAYSRTGKAHLKFNEERPSKGLEIF